jgi:hypothetical protein
VSNGHPLLLAPLRYWSIQHPVKRRWDMAFPAMGSAVLTAALLFWPAVPSPYGAGGFLPSLQNLFAILGGFFVSALTLVATSSAPGLMQPLSGSPPVRLSGQGAPLTRQRFLALLFGYLAFSAFALYALGFAAMLVAPGAKNILPTGLHVWASALFLLIYNFWLSHLFVSTMVGLYYFTDRLQRPDPEITRGSGPGMTG